MAKPITLIFCGNDYESASRLARQLRTGANHVLLCAPNSVETQIEDAAEVLVMEDVSTGNRKEIFRVYPNAKNVGNSPLPKLNDAGNVVAMPMIPVKRRPGRPRKAVAQIAGQS